MAALKLLNNKSTFSLSQGFRNYFYCCFPSGETQTSPTRSTEGVLKEDELGKTSNNDNDDEDGGSLQRRQSLIADNFGYETDLTRSAGTNMSNSGGSINLLNCEQNQPRLCQPSEKSRIVQCPSGQQRNDNSTVAVKKGLTSLLAIADMATKSDVADDSSRMDSEDSSKILNPDESQAVTDGSQPPTEVRSSLMEPSHVDDVDNVDGASPTSSALPSGDKKCDAADEPDIGSAKVASTSAENPNTPCCQGAGSVAMATGGTLDVDGVDGHLFDISDLQHNNSAGSSVVPSCGSVLLALSHDSHVNRMSITIKEARDLPSRERGGVSQTQVRSLLLPLRKVRHKTKVVVASESVPVFNETFECKVPTDDLTGMGLRVRLYGCERLRRDRLVGETIVNFSRLNTNGVPFWAPLEPRSNLSHGDSWNSVASLTHSESDSSTHSLQHGGTLELMLGLSYSGVTGRMAVEVIKGSNFKNVAAKRPPDTYVKMALMAPNGQEITRSKTSIRRGQPNPLFKETFMFQVAQSQLPDVSLLVSVFVQKSLKRKEMIGWFTMGNTNSSEDDSSHWTAMLESKGEQVCRWHALLEP